MVTRISAFVGEAGCRTRRAVGCGCTTARSAPVASRIVFSGAPRPADGTGVREAEKNGDEEKEGCAMGKEGVRRTGRDEKNGLETSMKDGPFVVAREMEREDKEEKGGGAGKQGDGTGDKKARKRRQGREERTLWKSGRKSVGRDTRDEKEEEEKE